MSLNRQAFSLVEIMVGVCIFALAILPLVWMSSKQTTGAYHVGKHMMAGQLAASYMDNILNRDYKEIKEIQEKINGNASGYVLDPSDDIKGFINLKEMAEHLENEKANENIKSSFKNFKYDISLEKYETKEEKAIKVTVEVSYLVNETNKKTNDSRQSLVIHAYKFGEIND